MLTLFAEGQPAVCARVQATPPETLCTTIISVQQQLDGWNDCLPRAKTRAKLAGLYQKFTFTVQFLSRLRIVSFGEPAIERFEHLKKLKLNVGSMDLRIAAIVLEQDATLVTRNLRDFRRVPGLRIEDWSK
jgi:tRNA(fMet)-specific endonuclease VapC